MNDAELVTALHRLRATMISVATGGARIGEVEQDFAGLYDGIDVALGARNIENTLPYRNLWDWYGRWSSGDLPSYQSRRAFVGAIVDDLVRRIHAQPGLRIPEPTGWAKVDRNVTEIRKRLGEAQNEEQFQAVGLLCREAMISLAEAVFDPHRHPTLDGTRASKTDAKRMLEAYVAATLGGSAHDDLRKFARAAVDLAAHFQHSRSADFREAAACVEAGTALINLIAILEGVRDP